MEHEIGSFETIILIFMYLFCYGFTLAMFIKDENVWFRFFGIIASLALAFYAPLWIGGALYEKLNNENS